MSEKHCHHCGGVLKTPRQRILEILERAGPNGVKYIDLLGIDESGDLFSDGRLVYFCKIGVIHKRGRGRDATYFAGEDPERVALRDAMERAKANKALNRSRMERDAALLYGPNVADLPSKHPQLWFPVNFCTVKIGEKFFINWFDHRFFGRLIERTYTHSLVEFSDPPP